MSSLLTNASALTALQNLAMTQKNLQTVQNQISTGLKISSAADNASAWAIATTMKSDIGALGAVNQALGQSSSMIGVFSSAINNAINVMNNIKNDLVSAKQPGADLNKIGTDIAQQSAQLQSVVSSSSYNGQNWLDGSNSTINVVASFNRSSAGATSVGTLAITAQALIGTATGTTGFGLLEGGTGSAAGTGTNFVTATVSSSTTSAQLDTMIADADKTLGNLQTYAANLGATQSRIGLQQTFVSNLSDALTKGVGSMVDADMNDASTRLQALQTQQQLGVQSLSIANQNTQLILKLFGG
ncbi:MAG: flagellin [Hyphomicrobiales bacterium]|nr:flagellin [Hyphomicrobiales bacterium]